MDAMDPPDSNVRRTRRYEKPFTLRLQRTSGLAKSQWSYVFLKDISVGGLSFRSDESFLDGEMLNLKICVGRNIVPIDCTGQIVRTRALGTGDFCEAALIFVDIRDEDVDSIRRVIKENPPDAYE